MELPIPARLRKAQAVSDQWHGKIVEHHKGATTRTGRLFFQDVCSPNWLKIRWADGMEEEFTTRILPRLAKIPEDQAPAGICPKPPAFRVVVAEDAKEHMWSLRTAHDVQL